MMQQLRDEITNGFRFWFQAMHVLCDDSNELGDGCHLTEARECSNTCTSAIDGEPSEALNVQCSRYGVS